MDSQKAGNYANVGMFFLTILALIVSMATLGYMYWIRVYPDPEKVPPMMDVGVLETGWLAVILVASSALISAVALLISSSRRWRNKKLLRQIDTLDADLTTERNNVADAAKDIEKLKRDLKEAGLRENDQRNQKETVLTELRKREDDLAELRTLRAMREGQAGNIKDHVIMTGLNPIELKLQGNADSGPCVTLTIFIRNESLYNVAIRPNEIQGRLAFGEQALQEPIIVVIDAWNDPIDNLKPLGSASIVLRQPLRGFEVERIMSLPDGAFRLAPLRIPITVVNSQYKVLSKNLRITAEFDHIRLDAFCVTKNVDSKD
ncbi:MAG: hypothetical protein LC794_08555 [Acidobacteria bacterium]|nr:hypothetical protein [Acidobacteriota bacterium]